MVALQHAKHGFFEGSFRAADLVADFREELEGYFHAHEVWAAIDSILEQDAIKFLEHMIDLGKEFPPGGFPVETHSILTATGPLAPDALKLWLKRTGDH